MKLWKPSGCNNLGYFKIFNDGLLDWPKLIILRRKESNHIKKSMSLKKYLNMEIISRLKFQFNVYFFHNYFNTQFVLLLNIKSHYK